MTISHNWRFVMVNSFLAYSAIMLSCHTPMGLFTRSFSAAMATAGLNKSQVAAIAGIDQSTVSRLLNNERDVYAEHAEALVRALPNPSDRDHCLRNFLIDQCPLEYRDRLVVHFGALEEPRPKPEYRDELSADLSALELEAQRNPDLRRVLSNLAKYSRGDR
jgi:transcriptional regulator with XRE-family HTH domain